MEEEILSKAHAQSDLAFEAPNTIRSASNAVHAAITPLAQRQASTRRFSLHGKVPLCTPIMSFGVLLPGRTSWVTAFLTQPQSAGTGTGSAEPSAASSSEDVPEVLGEQLTSQERSG